MNVHDNFLTEEKFLEVQKTLLSDNFPWYLGEIVPHNLSSCTPLDNIQLWHGFYDGFMPISDYCLPLMNYFVDILQPKALIKIKANLTMKTNQVIEHGYHIDLPYPDGFKTGVFYLNSNDGYTKFSNGLKVESIKNRFVEFEGDIPHTGTTCTDSQFRAVINFNYI